MPATTVTRGTALLCLIPAKLVPTGQPQSWNGYAHVMNNPMSNVDPSGLFLSADPGGGFWSGLWNAFSGFFGNGDCGASFCTTGYGVPDQNPGPSNAS